MKQEERTLKCHKCGTEFSEGIFCPECGFKNSEGNISLSVTDEATEAEKQRLAERETELLERERRLKEESERLEAQRKKEAELLEKEKKLKEESERLEAQRKKEKENAERIAVEKAEREAQEKAEAEKRAREQEKAEKLKKDNEIIEHLKSKLMSTMSQEERRSILSEFNESFHYESSEERVEELRRKANQKQPRGSMLNWVFGVTIILAIIITGILGGTGNSDSAFLIVAAIWYGLGIPVWIIWRIVLIIRSKSKKYCLNIKHI